MEVTMFSAILNMFFSGFKFSLGYSTNVLTGGGLNFSTNSIYGGGNKFSSDKKDPRETEEDRIKRLEKELKDIEVQIAFLNGKKDNIKSEIKRMREES